MASTIRSHQLKRACIALLLISCTGDVNTPSPSPTDGQSIDPTDTVAPTPTRAPTPSNTSAATPTESQSTPAQPTLPDDNPCPPGPPPIPPQDFLDIWVASADSRAWARTFTADQVSCIVWPGLPDDPRVAFQGRATSDKVTPGDSVLFITTDPGTDLVDSCETGECPSMTESYWRLATYWGGPLPGVPMALGIDESGCNAPEGINVSIATNLSDEHGRTLIKAWTKDYCVAMFARWTRCYGEGWMREGGSVVTEWTYRKE